MTGGQSANQSEGLLKVFMTSRLSEIRRSFFSAEPAAKRGRSAPAAAAAPPTAGHGGGLQPMWERWCLVAKNELNRRPEYIQENPGRRFHGSKPLEPSDMLVDRFENLV